MDGPAMRTSVRKKCCRMNFLERRSNRTGQTRRKSMRWWHNLADASFVTMSAHRADVCWRRRSLRTHRISVWAADTRQGNGLCVIH